MKLIDYDLNLLSKLNIQDPVFEMIKQYPGVKRIGIEGDEILFLTGIVHYWEGMGEIWFYKLCDLKKNWRIFPLLKRKLQKYLKGYERLQAHILEGHIEGERVVKYLGFEHESFQRKWRESKNYNCYVRIQ